MAQFTGGGAVWEVNVNATVIKHVRAECRWEDETIHASADNEGKVTPGEIVRGKPVDLANITEGMLTKLLADPVHLLDVLLEVCARQVDERGLTGDDFGLMLGGDVLADACEALTMALVEFEPNRRMREMITNWALKARRMKERVSARAAASINTALEDANIEAEIDARVDRSLKVAAAQLKETLADDDQSDGKPRPKPKRVAKPKRKPKAGK